MPREQPDQLAGRESGRSQHGGAHLVGHVHEYAETG
jgi:hypothetical protein